MIARLDIELPYSITLNRGVTYDELRYDRAGYHITVYPPLESPIPDSATKPDSLEINGRDTLHSNHLRIDFAAETFSRLKEPNRIDTDLALISEVVNDLLSKLRFISRAHRVQSIDFPNLDWTITYLNDDGTQIPATTAEYSLIGARKHHVRPPAATGENDDSCFESHPTRVAAEYSDMRDAF